MNDSMQMMNQSQIGNAASGINPIAPNIVSQKPVLVQSQVMNPPSAVLNGGVQPQIMSQSQGKMVTHKGGVSQQPVMLMKRGGFVSWPQQPSTDPNQKFQLPPISLKHSRNNNKNWKGKNIGKKERRNEMSTSAAASLLGASGYQPPSLKELQMQNRAKARKFYHSKKKYYARFAPYAPRNTTSFIIRAKKSGGIASLVSPCPVTPAVLPTPIFSPSREILGDTAKEEWGVDGYGSMKGLIRLRSLGHEIEANEDDDDEEEGNGSSESDVEEHVEVERRLDHDLSRFEMICPSYGGRINVGDSFYSNVLENRVDDQDTHIAHLEEENLTLKERLFLMEREMGDLKRRLHFLERQRGESHNSLILEGIHEEIMENVSENDENESYGGSDAGVNGSDNVIETSLGDDKETESEHTQEGGDIFEGDEVSAATAGPDAQAVRDVEASANKDDFKVEDEVFLHRSSFASLESSMLNAARLSE